MNMNPSLIDFKFYVPWNFVKVKERIANIHQRKNGDYFSVGMIEVIFDTS